MFRNKGLGHKWLEKKSISLVEKNVRKTECFFDNHYKSPNGNPGIRIGNPASF